MTLEEVYDEFMGELDEYKYQESLVVGLALPPKKTDPGSVTIICQIGEKM
jgi:hypothetical protein